MPVVGAVDGVADQHVHAVPQLRDREHQRRGPFLSSSSLSMLEAEANAPGCIRFQVDSDTQVGKILAALLVLGIPGTPARDVAMVPVDFRQDHISITGSTSRSETSRSRDLQIMSPIPCCWPLLHPSDAYRQHDYLLPNGIVVVTSSTRGYGGNNINTGLHR